MNEDYRSRAIGVIAAMGVLITGVVVNQSTARAPQAASSAPGMPTVVVVARPVNAPHLEPKCDPVC